MGRGNKKRKMKRKKHMMKRNSIRLKMGKTVFFTLTHCCKKLSGISNKYNYKANMHSLCYVGARFYNVKFQASIITDCNYRNASIIGVNYYNCNMKGTSFKNARLNNVVFFNCNLKGTDFSGTKFCDVTFICSNLQGTKNLEIDNPGVRILRTYSPIPLNKLVEKELLKLAYNESLFNAKVLHVSKNKLNQWTLQMIYQKYGIEGIEMLSRILRRKTKWDNMYTIFSYMLLIENLKKK